MPDLRLKASYRAYVIQRCLRYLADHSYRLPPMAEMLGFYDTWQQTRASQEGPQDVRQFSFNEWVVTWLDSDRRRGEPYTSDLLPIDIDPPDVEWPAQSITESAQEARG